MANISKEIQDFKTAVYGEDVRDSMVSLAEKVNAEAENSTQKVAQYGQAESQRAAAESQRVTAENQRKTAETSRAQEFKTLKQESEDATEAANTAAQNANAKAVLAASATETATGAASAANAAAGSVDAVKQAAQEATEEANEAAANANNKAELANTAAGSANEAADRANEAAEKAEGVVLDDISAFTVTFQEALERANIQSGDSLATAFGKLAKFCADMQDYVFSAPIDNLLSTDSTRPLAASMGKALKDEIGDLNDLPTTDKSSLVAAIAEQNSSLIGYGAPNVNYIDTNQETECRYIKIGHICHVSLTFVPKVTFGAEYTLFSGLPEVKSHQEFPYVVEREDGLVKVGQFRAVGQTILNWYGDSPKIGTPVKTGITYITK